MSSEGILKSQVHISKNEKEYLRIYQGMNRTFSECKFDTICETVLNEHFKTPNYHLTNSGTASLEIACLLIDLKPGDEVIIPSFTFSSTANALVLRGAVPVFVDVKPDTLNLDETLVVKAITRKTKAIIAVHYAGIACNMRELTSIAKNYGLCLIEDAAQAFGSYYFGKPLGTLADFGAISFHHTKNIHCEEGGLFFCKNSNYQKQAAHVIEKGTNRTDLIQGKVTKYHWERLGSSYVLSTLQKAILASQLEEAEFITKSRKNIWNQYNQKLEKLEAEGLISRPKIEPGSTVNGHIFYIILNKDISREKVINQLNCKKIIATSHYEPLHKSPAGKKYGRNSGNLKITDRYSKQLLRLPIFTGMSVSNINYVIAALEDLLIKQ